MNFTNFKPMVLAADPATVLGNIKTWLTNIATGVGAIILIWGAIQFFLALRDQNPDGQQRAIWAIVAGAALAALPTILSTLGI